ncbi:MAG: hypothetical protein IPM48_14405 [Saprospiraceae bacterium]|nr:hypothetical protein [Saprospiraceae bacterium]
MGYNNDKGGAGEREFADYLSKITGLNYVRIGGAEAGKKILFGDVVRRGGGECFLDNYFLESKKMAHPNVINIVEEHDEKGKQYGKWGSICYIVRQERGEKRSGAVVAMSPETFARIARELHGYNEKERTDKESGE